MITGRPPFSADDPMALVHAHMALQPDRPEGVPDAVADVLMKALEKNPEDRYQSASGLRDDLQRCLDAHRDGRELDGFEAGATDASPLLRLSQHLYGREEQVRSLTDAFERCRDGAVELLLVAGYSGVGKSSLVHEVHKTVTAARGRFAGGKFDLLNNTPYSALARAIGHLARVLAVDSKDPAARRLLARASRVD